VSSPFQVLHFLVSIHRFFKVQLLKTLFEIRTKVFEEIFVVVSNPPVAPSENLTNWSVIQTQLKSI
jgi:hypothetical protein